ncbi:hypothetical protein DIPPA_33339, partial [Diplonema papillatum]
TPPPPPLPPRRHPFVLPLAGNPPAGVSPQRAAADPRRTRAHCRSVEDLLLELGERPPAVDWGAGMVTRSAKPLISPPRRQPHARLPPQDLDPARLAASPPSYADGQDWRADLSATWKWSGNVEWGLSGARTHYDDAIARIGAWGVHSNHPLAAVAGFRPALRRRRRCRRGRCRRGRCRRGGTRSCCRWRTASCPGGGRPCAGNPPAGVSPQRAAADPRRTRAHCRSVEDLLLELGKRPPAVDWGAGMVTRSAKPLISPPRRQPHARLPPQDLDPARLAASPPSYADGQDWRADLSAYASTKQPHD